MDGRLCLMVVPFSSCGVERANSTHHLQGIFFPTAPEVWGQQNPQADDEVEDGVAFNYS